MSKKITFIGAGSLDFTRDLVTDILTFKAFEGCEIMLMDIDEKRLKYARDGVRHLINASGCSATVSATMNRKEALRDSDGVLITILQGGADVWRHDIEIPMKYGVDLCVGDTRGPAGIFRFLRTAPVMLDIIRDIEEVCRDAVVLNYTNPMAMLVSYLQAQTNVSVTGICHSVANTASMIANWIGVNPDDLAYTCAGINHQAFYLDLQVNGKDAYPLLWNAIQQKEITEEEPVRIEMFKYLKYFPTESSGHNSEYNAWFRKRPDLIEKYCTHGTGWNPGKHAYILKEYMERVDTWEKEYSEWLNRETIKLERSGEYTANIFNAIFGDHEAYKFNANVRNKGYITNIDNGACVEIPALASRYGIYPIGQLTLPPQLEILISNSAKIEELAVQAAIQKDPEKVFEAILFDPLTASVCSMDEIHAMVQEMMDKNAPFLSYFKNSKNIRR